MTWVKFDDTFPEREDMQRVGPLGMALHVAATCYCNRNLTDGRVLRSTVRRLIDVDDSEAVAAALVDAGTWKATEDGYELTDYFPNQFSAAKVQRLREVRADAGRKGGAASGRSRQAKAKQVASNLLEANANPTPSRHGRGGRARSAARPHPPSCSDPNCDGGWLGEDDDGRRTPCLTCKPHLKARSA